ncbi:glycosyltransferase family 2 protein [Candidatus Woesearchaeota archaeon]|nr:glycosyltransferase family 2 protein [Candidatus Woesearchaeota archaeon]
MLSFGDILIYVATFFGLFTSIYFFITLIERRSNLHQGETKKYQPVTICIPCYNEELTLEKTLESLVALDYDKKQLEIIIVDDGSKDKTYKIAKQFAKQHPASDIKVFRKENGGKYTALNFALTKARGRFFGALDADSFVDPKALRRIMKFFEDKKVAIVTPSMKIYKPKGILRRIQAIEYLMGIFLRKVFAELGSIHVTPGPFSIYRMEVFEKYGPYKKAYHTEDIEISLRAQTHHLVIENSVDAFVYTVGPKTFKTLYKQRLRWYHGFIRNVLDYKQVFTKQHGNLGLFILPASFISVFLLITIITYVLITRLSNIRETLQSWTAINFDFSTWEWFNFDTFFLNTSGPAMVGIIALLFTISIIVIAKIISKEKKPIFYSYIFFALFYAPLYAFWWLVSIWYVLFTKDKVQWGHKSENKNEATS